MLTIESNINKYKKKDFASLKYTDISILRINLTFSTSAGSSDASSVKSLSISVLVSFPEFDSTVASLHTFSKSSLDSRAKKFSAPISSAADDKYEPMIER